MNPLFKLVKVNEAQTLGSFNADPDRTTFGPAPLIVPYSASTYNAAISKAPKNNVLTTINVTNEFPWTNAPRLVPGNADTYLNARYDVPSLELREESILQNPALNNIARNLFIARDNIAELEAVTKAYTENANPQIKSVINTYLAFKAGQAASTVTGSTIAGGATFLGAGGALLTGFGDDIISGAGAAAKNVADKLKPYDRTQTSRNNANPWGGFSNYDQYMAPYQDIYTTRLTGWRYKLPYMSDLQRQNMCNFSDSAQSVGGVGTEDIQRGTDKAAGYTSILNTMMAPGVYIDRAKSFSYSGGEKSYTCTFPLLNTTNQADILRNWQLLFLLTYQNRPNRIDRVQIAPPKIYEGMIPGVWYSRYCYISNLSVNFVGNRRKMTLYVPIASASGTKVVTGRGSKASGKQEPFTVRELQLSNTPGGAAGNDNTRVTTIVPDAYQVSITVTELIPESQNTMFAAIQKPNTVSVGSFEDTDNPLGNSLFTP